MPVVRKFGSALESLNAVGSSSDTEDSHQLPVTSDEGPDLKFNFRRSPVRLV